MPNKKISDPMMPDKVCRWMRRRKWHHHHAQWHYTRLWDFLEDSSPAIVDWMKRHDWQRAPRQAGDPGSGLDFLAMHRVMIRMVQQNFQSALPSPWQTPPQ